MNRKILVTGGAGFIGSALVRRLIRHTDCRVVNYDLLTYAGNLESLREVADDPRYAFIRGDIGDREAVGAALRKHEIDAVIHLAAESHVDRSIDGPLEFLRTNALGTGCLLEAVRAYLKECPPARRDAFRFLHVSTDEVYGSLGSEGLFTEETPYDPRSPYSASKAAADQFVRAWHHTYGLPVLITNCSNNYGAYQFPEKLIPLLILNALDGKALPIYGKGDQIRDWLYVDDHAAALLAVLEKGRLGRTYNIGGRNERTNLEVARAVCALLDELAPERRRPELGSYADLIEFVADRPGHDRRYAIDPARIEKELEFRPADDFTTGLRKTVAWYCDNEWWWRPIRAGQYAGDRLGRGERA